MSCLEEAPFSRLLAVQSGQVRLDRVVLVELGLDIIIDIDEFLI